MLSDSIGSALVNLVVLVLVPMTVYYAVQRIRHGRGLLEVTGRAGLRLGEPRYVGYCAVVALALVGWLILVPPPLEAFVREGSAQRRFVGLGASWTAIVGALLYGVVQTGFCEELLFRGMIAGSLSRRLSASWANLIQAGIFLLPHLALLFIMPEMWPVLILVLAGALFTGWVRIVSGSILGPWLLHASVNVTMALSVAIRST